MTEEARPICLVAKCSTSSSLNKQTICFALVVNELVDTMHCSRYPSVAVLLAKFWEEAHAKQGLGGVVKRGLAEDPRHFCPIIVRCSRTPTNTMPDMANNAFAGVDGRCSVPKVLGADWLVIIELSSGA